MQNHIQDNNNERAHFFRKIYLSLYLKWFLKVLLSERWVGDWTELQHIDPDSYGHNSVSFPFSWAAQPGAWRPTLYWDMVLVPASSFQLPDFLSHPGYIIVIRPLNSTRRQWRLSPDLFDRMHLLFTLMYFFFRQLGWVGGQYATLLANFNVIFYH